MTHSPHPKVPAGIKQGLWRWGSRGPGGHAAVVHFWLLFCCSLHLHPTLTVHKWTKMHYGFLLSLLSALLQKFSHSNLTRSKHLISISLLKRLAAWVCSGGGRLHQGNEITYFILMKEKRDILMLCVMVKSHWLLANMLTPRLSLMERKKNQIPFTAKIPTKIRKKFLICLVMVDNQDNKSSSGLILFQARKTC